MNRFTRKATSLLAGLALAAGSFAAHAEGQIRIAEQFGRVNCLRAYLGALAKFFFVWW